jgi:hypothetical protein
VLSTLRARGCGCIGHPAFPTPFDFQGEDSGNNSGAVRGEIAELHLAVIARSEATKQSIFSLHGAMDCFAAMTNYAASAKRP